MKIDIFTLKEGKEVTLVEEVVLDLEIYPALFPLHSVDSLLVVAKVIEYSDFINVDLEIKANVTLTCCYSLENFPYKIHEKISTQFALYEEGATEDVQLVNGNTIELDSLIYDLVSVGVPAKPIKPGAKKPDSGNGYRVISEEEYLKEKETATDPRFDKLSELDFDEE